MTPGVQTAANGEQVWQRKIEKDEEEEERSERVEEGRTRMEDGVWKVCAYRVSGSPCVCE